MRSPRIVVAALGVALAASMAATAPVASARDDQQPAAASAQRVETPAAQAPTAQRASYSITARVVKKRPAANKPYALYLRGNVYGARGKVSIQKATVCSRNPEADPPCKFAYYRTVTTNSAGVYEARIEAAPGRRSYVWRARFQNAYSDIWQTCTKRPDQDCAIPYP